MTSGAPSLSSVTRWLLVVVGCAVLETAQPMNAAEPASGPAPDQILYPADSRPSASPGAPAPSPSAGPAWAFVLFVGLGAGCYWLWRRRSPVAAARRGGIVIEDTRALGNRQFLVVAGVDGRRFLLGVAPGSIRLLSDLDSAPGTEDGDHDDA